jgi:DivIVA domain-containing protein
MRPDEILHRDFLVGLRGYDKDEVRGFLADVAAEHAELLAELEAARSGPAPTADLTVADGTAPADDDFANLGASVAAILRTAKASAAEITEAAEARAAQTRDEIEDLRYRAVVEADELRATARTAVDEAQAEATRILREAEARVANLEEDAAQRRSDIRTRLQEASEELQLVLMALDAGQAIDLRADADAESLA